MGSYRIAILETAVAELKATPFPFRRQINQRIMTLKVKPFPAGFELVTEDRYRLGVAGWWVLYEVDSGADLVTVVAVIPKQPA